MVKARVVYNGVGRGGDLFKDMKFYLLQRVPTRDRWKDLIQSNGGEVVHVESQADIIIGDHARKNQPAGTISWKFIEESVKNGELDDVEKYRAGPAQRTIREAGSKKPTKQVRTPFTAEDDRILTQWVTRAERRGVKTLGNVLFQELEQRNNRHPWQSWRDRWIKQLMNSPRPNLPTDDEEEEVKEPVKVGTSLPAPARKPTHSKNLPIPPVPRSSALAQKESVQRESSHRRLTQPAPAQVQSFRRTSSHRGSLERESVPKSTPVKSTPQLSHDIFTEEESRRIIDLYDDILTVKEDRMIDFWMTWAAQYEEHTAQEWYNHFREYIVPKMKSKEKPKNVPPPAKTTAVKQVSPEASSSRTSRQEIAEVKDSQGQYSGQTREFSDRYPLLDDPSISDEKVFQNEISTFGDEFEINIDFNPMICGQSISLFRLWQVVESDEFGGYGEVDGRELWAKVASRLQIDPTRHPTAAKELKKCFGKVLVDYEEFKKGDLENMEEEDHEEEAIGGWERHESSLAVAQLGAKVTRMGEAKDPDDEFEEVDQQEQEEHDDDLDYPTSAKKRGLDDRRSLAYNKRQRVQRGKNEEREIPSTPEDNVNNPKVFTPQSSPLKFSALAGGGVSEPEEEYSEDDGLFVPETQERSKSRDLLQPRNIEPETQDFDFPDLDPGPSHHRLSSEFSSSPPQVLPKLKYQSQGSNAATRGSPQSTGKEDSSTQSQTESQKEAQVERFVNDLVKKGFAQESVIQALEATSLELGPNVEKVAESLDLESGIPDNLRGVWTSLDDEVLFDPVESKEYKRILKKHGMQGLRERKKFLRNQQAWRDENAADE